MDKEQTTKYLKWLFASGHRSLVIQTFGEGQTKGDKKLVRVLTPKVGVQKLLAGIEALETRGAGVFVQVQAGSNRGNKHITDIRCVFVDLDGAPLDSITNAVRRGFPKPSMIVESSKEAPGGARYHVYWRVADVDLQSYSYVQRQLATTFGGDPAVHDLSRVMRLPGTRNFKYNPEGEHVSIIHFKDDLKPVLKGDLVEACALVSGHLPEREVTGKEVVGVVAESQSFADGLVMDGYDKERVSDITELKPGDRTQKIVRIAGAMVAENPDDDLDTIKRLLVAEVERLTPHGTPGPTSDAWRHEIFPAVERFIAKRDREIEEVRREVSPPPEVVDNEEYSSAFEAFNATRDVAPMTLAQFADRFVVVNSTRQVVDLTKSPAQVPWSVAAFRDYAAVFRNEGKPLFGQWMKNRPLRRSVDKLLYKPFAYTADKTKIDLQRIVRDDETGEICYNTYAVPQLKPVAQLDEATYRRHLKPFVEHIKYLMQTEDKTRVMLDWLAATVQRPDKRVTWAPLIVTRYEGVGKGWLSQVIKQLIGPTNHSFVTADEFDKQVQYTDFMVDCTLLVIDEVYAPRRPDIKNRINALITEPTMEINRKFGTKRRENIYCNVVAFSNHPDALDLTTNDRRFFVNIHKSPPKEASYYNKLFNWLEGGQGPSVVMHWLLRRDLSSFNWGECPRVDGDSDKRAMQVENLSEIEQVLDSLFEDKEGPFAGAVTCKQLIQDYLINTVSMQLAGHALPELKKWLRSHGESVGRVVGMPHNLRHQTFYCLDPTLPWRQNVLQKNAEAKKSVRGVYGDNTLYLVSEEED